MMVYIVRGHYNSCTTAQPKWFTSVCLTYPVSLHRHDIRTASDVLYFLEFGNYSKCYKTSAAVSSIFLIGPYIFNEDFAVPCCKRACVLF